MGYFEIMKTAGFEQHLGSARVQYLQKLGFDAPTMDIGGGFGSGVTPQVGAAMSSASPPKRTMGLKPKKRTKFRQQAPGAKSVTPQAAAAQSAVHDAQVAGKQVAPDVAQAAQQAQAKQVVNKATPVAQTARGQARGAKPVAQAMADVAQKRTETRAAQAAQAARKANMGRFARRAGVAGAALGGLGLASYGIGRGISALRGEQQKAASAAPTIEEIKMAAFFDELSRIASS